MKYLKVGVTRESSTDLYIEVPDDFDPMSILRASHRNEIGLIAAQTTDDSDWDQFEWEKTVEAHEVTEVTEAEATQFIVGTLRAV